MGRNEQRRQITDVRALVALAHPIRVALLNQLMAFGPRTASQCAAAVGASASACSYHLRQLARWGLVEPVAATDARERPWQASATGFAFQADLDDPAGRAVQQTLVGMQLEQDAEAARAFLRRIDMLEPAWRDAVEFGRFSLLLTPAELRRLIAALDAAIRPYIGLTRADPPADARPVHLDLKAFPEPAEPAGEPAAGSPAGAAAGSAAGPGGPAGGSGEPAAGSVGGPVVDATGPADGTPA